MALATTQDNWMQPEDFTSTPLAQLAVVSAASVYACLVVLAHMLAEIVYYQISAAAWLALLVQIASPTGKRGGGGELEGNLHFPAVSNFLIDKAAFLKRDICDQESEPSLWKFPYENPQFSGMH